MRIDKEQLKCLAYDNGWDVHAEDAEQRLITFRTKKVIAVLDVWDGRRGITLGLLLCGKGIVRRSKMYFKHCSVKDVNKIIKDVEYWRKLADIRCCN